MTEPEPKSTMPFSNPSNASPPTLQIAKNLSPRRSSEAASFFLAVSSPRSTLRRSSRSSSSLTRHALGADVAQESAVLARRRVVPRLARDVTRDDRFQAVVAVAHDLVLKPIRRLDLRG